MSLSWFFRMLKKKSRPVARPGRKQPYQGRYLPALESLDERILLSTTALFSPSTGILNVFGDSRDNTIAVSRDAAGRLLVNGGAIGIQGGAATVANTSLIEIFGQAGNDQLSLDETNGALPSAMLFGGAGDDTLIGGSAADLLFGQAGNDTLLGKGGDDFLFGGAGDDVLTGGVGNDQVFGEAGNDRMIWNPGEGTDLNEGGAGNDTVEVNGGNGAETFTVNANGTRVRLDRVTPAPFSLDIGTTENLVVNMNGGDDVFTASNGLAPLISLTVDGGAGNDNITGGDGNDRLIGGDGNDIIIGGRGSDTVLMGAGDDQFIWNPGDGSDVVEGQDGYDAMIFNGANVNENIVLTANGQRVRLTRDVGAVTMDINAIENVTVNALGGADNLTVNDLTGTGLTTVNLNLGVTGGAGDGQADTVNVFGSNGNDTINIVGQGTAASVLGLPATVNITGSEGTLDSLVVNALGGDDNVSASTLPTGVIQLAVDGGVGNDMIIGSQGADRLIGGDGDDFVDGKGGSDVVALGAGNDVFQWDPGDGSDVVEGQDGNDRLLFNGSNVDENIDISANGTRVRFSRNVGNITMDLNGIEEIDFNALDGADAINVNNLAGTDVTTINLNLNTASSTGDGKIDSVIVNATDADNTFQIASVNNGSLIAISGASPQVNITGAEGANDSLTINALGGNDTVDASNLAANLINLTLNGGAGNDLLIGSQGNDLVNGGTGSDSAFLGAGDDVFVWNPGDGSDVVEGQDGHDILQFNGANVDENIDLAANGTRLRLTRNVGNVTMDVNGVEQVNVVARGGADTINVHDLSGTDVTDVNLDLAGTPGTSMGDGQQDTVNVDGTSNDDVIVASGDNNGIDVSSLTSHVHIAGAESTDRLNLYAGAGDDVVLASGLPAGAIRLKADGGDGDDVLVGSNGDDTLLGGGGDDILIGLQGQDILDGGTGDNVLIQ